MSKSKAIEKYLFLYNGSQLVGWSSLVLLTLSEIYKNKGDYRSVYASVFPTFCKIQTMAILETVHTTFGLVRTPLKATLLQMASRMFLTWGVSYNVPEIAQHWSFTSMLLAWSMAEIVRSGYYILPKGIMSKARYNAFIVLFPWGFLSEIMLCYQSAMKVKTKNTSLFLTITAVVLFLYFPGFPWLYLYMFRQRAKHLK